MSKPLDRSIKTNIDLSLSLLNDAMEQIEFTKKIFKDDKLSWQRLAVASKEVQNIADFIKNIFSAL